MTPNHDANPRHSLKILWGCLVLAASGLFALLPDDTRALQQMERKASLEAVQAGEPERQAPESEVLKLQQKVHSLEAEIATLKRCSSPQER